MLYTNSTNNEIEDLIQELDRETMGHCVGMQQMAFDLENYFGFKNKILSTSALLCDVGKLYFSSYLLEKQEGLTQFERELLHLHPYYSYKTIKDFDIDDSIKSLVLYHHEYRFHDIQDNLPRYDESLRQLYTTLELIDAYQGLIEYRAYRSTMCTPYDAYEILNSEENHNKEVLDYIKNNYLY